MGDPGAAGLRSVLIARDWRSAQSFLGSVTDPDDRAFYVNVCGSVEGVQDWIDEWIAAEPDSTLPLLVKGAHGIKWAWEARGAAVAEMTSEQQFREFHRRLKVAEDCLDEVVERDPDDVAAWSFLVVSARGRQVGREETLRRFHAATSRHPGHVHTHSQMLQWLCAKWFGSEEEMFAFARRAVTDSPPGSPLGRLVAEAHLEKWLSLDRGEDEEYMARPDVRAELRAAADHSVRHPAYRRRPGWPEDHNLFACAFVLAGDHVAARERFEALGDLVTERPWSYLGDPGRVCARMRQVALRHA
ncbi:hypothetical protein [Microbispora sp. GKU 823]|uniref:hypothetical protein n=1 Tax=Microbispora sp. GKU 823 TaxID=1652100 RepID=UPI0009A3B4F4|nr:hypothetical protein [Microbispora sp. GKU 823]